MAGPLWVVTAVCHHGCLAHCGLSWPCVIMAGPLWAVMALCHHGWLAHCGLSWPCVIMAGWPTVGSHGCVTIASVYGVGFVYVCSYVHVYV